MNLISPVSVPIMWPGTLLIKGRFEMRIFLALCLALGACSHSQTTDQEDHLAKVINNPVRTEKNKTRDAFRHPLETLTFFEVEPDMKVVEISPGSGWYTEILGPYLAKKGELNLAIFSEKGDKDYFRKANKTLKDKVAANSEHFGKVNYTTFHPSKQIGPIADSNSMDRVLTFRNIHNWMARNKANDAFKEFYRVLKPGGVLGVVEHREKSTRKQDPKAKSGYVREDVVIKMAEDAGFKLVAKSEINANPKDTADHVKGVWTLPPSMALKDKNSEVYQKIGESDRMTLKFIKP